MGLAPGQHAFMPAAAGLLRSDASRSDWHPAGTQVPLYALSNVARSAATRSNYVGTRPFIGIDGIVLPPRTDAEQPGILIDSLTVSDLLNYEPNRATFVAWGFVPKEGQRVVITLGSVNNLNRLFAGRIVNTEQFYEGKPANLFVAVNCIDDTWGLDTRKVSERYTARTYESIVLDLLAKYAAPTYRAAVEPDLGTIDEITFTNQDLTAALTQLAKRGAYDWLCDETAVVRFFGTTAGGTPPTILNAAHASLAAFHVQRDLSQVVTRVYVEGGGVNAFAAVAVGETTLPVEDAVWYPPAGVVVSGPQRIRYSGKYLGGGGGLVGTGASPSGAPSLALAPGAGLSPGPRNYAVTFVTGAGESIAGPTASITSGATAAPPTAPTVSAPTAATGPGVGPDPGVHEYAVTFLTPSGETIPGPRATATTGATPAPTGYPLPGAPTVGAGLDDGAHDYAVSFVTAIGETLVGPISSQVITGPLGPPTWAPTLVSLTAGSGPEAGPHGYAVTFVTGSGETLPGPMSTLMAGAPPPTAPTGIGELGYAGNMPQEYPGPRRYAVTFATATGETVLSPFVELSPPVLGPPPTAIGAYQGGFPPGTGGLTPGGWYYYAMTYVDPLTGAETAGGPISGPHQAGPDGILQLTNIPYSYAYYACLYRTVASGGTFYRENGPTFLMNITQSNLSDAVLVTRPQANPHGTVWASGKFTLTVPLGPAGTTSRKIYRTNADQPTGPFKLALGGAAPGESDAGMIKNNTGTTFVDYGGASLAEAPNPPTVTTVTARLNLASIAVYPGAGVTSRKLYRTPAGNLSPLALKLLATISGNTTTAYTDSTTDTNLGEQPPSDLPTARVSVVKLTEIPTGESGGGVTARKLYRRSGGAGLRYLATVSGNSSSSTYTDTIPNASLGAAPPAVSTAVLIRFALSAIAKGGALVTGRNLYRTAAGSAALRLLATLADNTTTTYVDVTPDAGLGAAPPAVTTATANQVALASIPIGAAAVIARKLYRTMAYGSQLQLLATLADNLTTAYLDAAADAALGANVNTVDTSGLTQPQGNVIAGSVSLQIANIGPFPPEGWAVIGNGQQVIRYRSVSGNVLGGIPPSGPGAILATIAYNSTVTASPQLVGIPPSGDGAIRYSILKGDPVNLWVQADNVAAQLALAALMGTDGIIEGYLQDRRLSYTEALARAEAQLALRGELEVAISYLCRDVNTRAGRVVRVNLPTQNVVMVDFQLRQVAITQFGIPNLLPTFTASASTDRFSFEALIRAARGGTPAGVS